jgi:hypothetical protein
LTTASTVLFTELVYSGSVNSSTNLPVNNFLLPQLTDYFPSGNPLRSCTTASLVSYTPNAQPALLKRAPQPVAVNTFPGVPDLTSTISYTAEAARVEPSPSAPSSESDGGQATATEDNGGSTNPPVTSSPQATSSAAPPPSQQDTQTAAEPSAAPPSPSTTQEALNTQTANSGATATEGPTQASNTALGTITVIGSSTQVVGNITSSQPSTWNYVCSAEGCTLASSSGATASSANASSTSTESASRTTAQSSAAVVVPTYGIGGLFLVMVMFSMG